MNSYLQRQIKISNLFSNNFQTNLNQLDNELKIFCKQNSNSTNLNNLNKADITSYFYKILNDYYYSGSMCRAAKSNILCLLNSYHCFTVI